MIAAPISGVGVAISACGWVACFKRSGIATTEESAVSLNTETQLLVSGGMTTRIACGRTTLRMAAQNGRPRAAAASNWPFGMFWMPARQTSAVKAASTSDSASAADAKDD